MGASIEERSGSKSRTTEDFAITLPAIPSLGTLYVQGLAGSVRNTLGLTAPGTEMVLPEVLYRVPDVATSGLATHLREYQELVHEAASDKLPSGYLHVLTFPLAMAVMARPDFPLPLLGMVHLANDASLLVPVTLGDTLEVQAWAENLRPHPKGATVDLVGEVWKTTPDGDPVLAWRGTSTYLAKGVKLPSAEETPSVEESLSDDVSKPRKEWQPPYPTGSWALGGGIGREYAAIPGDRNPIHLSALTAKAFGFPKAIAHGMYTAARALAEVGPGKGDTYRWTVEFAKPVLLPSKVNLAITPDRDGSYSYQGWNAKKQIKHFTGTVTPL